MTTTTHTFAYMDQPEHSFLKWALVTFPSASPLGSSEFINELSKRSDSLTNIELKITLNGLEVDAKAFMDRIDDAMDYAVERAVKKRIEEMPQFNELHDVLHDIERALVSKTRQLARDNNIELDKERW